MIKFRHYKYTQKTGNYLKNTYGFQIWSAHKGHRAIDIWWKKELFVFWIDGGSK